MAGIPFWRDPFGNALLMAEVHRVFTPPLRRLHLICLISAVEQGCTVTATA
ncbi:hypothetical protein [Streptomyces thioluteus]|uniref:hypothetical protein n=1 Tax=Streptomyces thioluteus TaxID=66431 RepID=UPI0031EB483C